MSYFINTTLINNLKDNWKNKNGKTSKNKPRISFKSTSSTRWLNQ